MKVYYDEKNNENPVVAYMTKDGRLVIKNSPHQGAVVIDTTTNHICMINEFVHQGQNVKTVFYRGDKITLEF